NRPRIRLRRGGRRVVGGSRRRAGAGSDGITGRTDVTRAQSLREEGMRAGAFDVAGVALVADLSGALYWEAQRLLVVSDLHLEKGSSFAARGVLLPPYDTAATLSRLAAVIARHDPRMVIALGDSFHDRDAHERLPRPDRDAISAMQPGRDWIWIAGNHDPA